MIQSQLLAGTFELEVFCHDGTSGRRPRQSFLRVNLEDRIPTDHLLRRIDAVLDLSWLRGELSP